MKVGIFYKQDNENIYFCGWRRIQNEVNQLIYALRFIREMLPEWQDSQMRQGSKFQRTCPFGFYRLKLIHNANKKRSMQIVVYSNDSDENPETITDETIFTIVNWIFAGHFEHVRKIIKDTLNNSETASKLDQNEIIKHLKDIASRHGLEITKINFYENR